MPNISSFSTLTSMFHTSNLVCQSVQLANELKISLEYDTSRGLLNIFVKNTDHNVQFPLHINILSNQSDDCQQAMNNNEYLHCPSDVQQDLENEITDISFREEDEPKICIELSNIYVYDLFDENENDLQETMIASSSTLVFSSSPSSSASSSCFDEQTTDNDDGYSTHSLDDIDHHHQQQQCTPMSSSKMLIPFVPYQHPDDSEDQISSSIPRLIEQLMWLSPFKKTFKQMMSNHLLI